MSGDDELIRRLKRLEAQVNRMSTIDRPRPLVARYETATAQSIANASAVIVQYDTRVFDPYSLVTTGAAWKFTAPLAGYYYVQAAASLQSTTAWALGEAASLRLYSNAAVQSLLDYNDSMNSSATAQIKWLSGGDVVNLEAGEYFDIRLVQSSGGALTLHPFAVHNYISIFKIN